MLRCALWVGLLAVLTVCPFGALHADDKKADDKKVWQEAELKKFQGRWTAFREEKTDQEKVRQQWVDLEFADSGMKIFILDEKRKQTWEGSLNVIGVEQVGPISRLILGSGEQKKAEVCCDFVGDKMILVGRIMPRPFEGFSLSGEYKRAEKPK